MVDKQANANIKKRERPWWGVVVQGVLLMTMWLFLSGHYDVFHISLGVMSVAVILIMDVPLKRIQLTEGDEFAWSQLRFGALVSYVPWLIWQIIISSLQVAYVVLHPVVPVKPSLLRFKTKLPHDAARVILGNSITLTPGTITLEIKGDEFLVHSLIPGSSASLLDGTMPAKVAALFRESPEQSVEIVEIIQSERGI